MMRWSALSTLAVSAGLLSSLLLAACTTITNPAGLTEQPATPAPAESRARVHTELAALYYQQGGYKTALAELNTAARIDASYAPTYNMLGLVYMQLGDNTQAAASFEQALALDAANPEIHNNYGLFLCNTRAFDAGLAQFDAALSNPLYVTPQRALANASRCAQAAGNADLAQQYQRRAESYNTPSSSTRPAGQAN